MDFWFVTFSVKRTTQKARNYFHTRAAWRAFLALILYRLEIHYSYNFFDSKLLTKHTNKWRLKTDQIKAHISIGCNYFLKQLVGFRWGWFKWLIDWLIDWFPWQFQLKTISCLGCSWSWLLLYSNWQEPFFLHNTIKQITFATKLNTNSTCRFLCAIPLMWIGKNFQRDPLHQGEW